MREGRRSLEEKTQDTNGQVLEKIIYVGIEIPKNYARRNVGGNDSELGAEIFKE